MLCDTARFELSELSRIMLRRYAWSAAATPVFVYRAVLVASLLLISATSAFSQDGGTILSKTWRYFIERCSFAYTEPQRYLDDLAAGRGNIGSTPDGSILRAGTTGVQLHDSFAMLEGGNRRRHECYVMGHFDADPISAERLNDDFVQNVVNQPGITVTGGRSSEELDKFYPAIPYRYVVLGALPNNIVVFITLGQSVVEIQSGYEFARD